MGEDRRQERRLVGPRPAGVDQQHGLLRVPLEQVEEACRPGVRHEAVATPLLEQLIAAIESHKLEEWEAGEMVAIPMSLMYRVLGTTEADPSTRQSLYLRICKLDPIQAISFTQS